MREKSFVNFQKRLFVVDEQIEQMALVTVRKVLDTNAVLCQLSQAEKTLFEFLRFFRGLFKLLELLAIVDLILEPPLHDVLAHLFDTIHEKRFQVISLRVLVNSLAHDFSLSALLTVNDHLQVSDGICVTCLKCLHILNNLVADVPRTHSRCEDQVDKLLKLDVLRRNVPIS